MVTVHSKSQDSLDAAIARKHKYYRYIDRQGCYFDTVYLLYEEPFHQEWALIQVNEGFHSRWVSRKKTAKECFDRPEHWEPFYGTIEVTE